MIKIEIDQDIGSCADQRRGWLVLFMIVLFRISFVKRMEFNEKTTLSQSLEYQRLCHEGIKNKVNNLRPSDKPI